MTASVFGQLFDELHFLEPRLLRIGYTHPMDDGQERSFKVKFYGEGVDDYGGPYREIFAQIPVDLQATDTKNELCLLPLLQPTPNSTNGSNEGNPQFMLRPQMTTHVYLAQSAFLGRLVGIAVRSKVRPEIQAL